MKIVEEKNKIEISELREMTKKMSEDLVKAVVDVEKEIMAVDAPMHADEEDFLMKETASKPQNLWGINIWPNLGEDKFIEFDSMINIKPGWGNRTRGIENSAIREKIKNIINKLIN